MADFKTALETLAKGEIKLASLSRQLDMLLQKSPGFATRMLGQLDEIHGQQKLNDQSYARLKRQINEFRRTHASETESGIDSGTADSTVFAQDSISEAAPATKPPTGANATTEKPGDSTVVMTEDKKPGDSTMVMTEDEKLTNTSADASDFFDISMPGANTGTPSITSTTGPTDTGWNEPNVPAGDLSGDYGEGSVIKQRFKLEKVLGIGGMGKVYKALDLLKAEARDKKPHVAIKLLNEDFKDHPEAFISLQRESSRQQKLAHPNIATIYDFDRVGGPGTPVFITMELMEGMELKDFIKKQVRPKGGLPFDEAYKIIKQLGAGLTYAHDRRLVHSDFKPGNAFYCNDGTVKTLDFGIARAVKNPVTGEVEKTLFDPGKLGALTPAYASLEMLEGEEPDTRDDTYALGCTAYELITGKHPFNKLPANKAKDNNLVPPYIKSLNKKQNRALRRSVAFHRKDRSQTVDHFVEELAGKATWHKNPFVIAAAVLLVIGIMLIVPAMDYLHQKELDAMVAEINQGGEQTVVAKLAEIRLLEKVDQTRVADEAKVTIQNYFSDELENLIATAEETYSYVEPEKVLAKIKEFYPDSIYLQEKTDLLVSSKKLVISNLTSEYVAALSDESLISNTKSIVDNIAKVDSKNPLLEDTSRANAYRLLAQSKFDANELDTALALVTSGIEFSGSADQRLLDLQQKIERTQTINQLEGELSELQGTLTSLAYFKQQQSLITQLANLKPNSELLAGLTTQFKPLIENELKSIQQQGTRQEVEILASEFGDLLNGLQLSNELTKIKLAKLTGSARKEKAVELANVSTTNIETALAEPQIENAQWEAELLKDIQQLDSLVSENKSIAAKLETFRNQIADIYVAKAEETLQVARFDVADNYVDVGERFAPTQEGLLKTRDAIASARDETDRLARIEADKLPFQSLTDGNNVAEAEKIFEQFKADLPADDLYLTTEAAPMLAAAYARLAKSKAETREFVAASTFIARGLEIDPGSIELNELKLVYASEANIVELSKLFNTALSFPSDVRQKVQQIANADPVRFAEFSNTSASVLSQRINALRETDEKSAATLANVAAGLFPANPVLANLKRELQLQPWGQFTNASAAVNEGKLSLATQIQQAAAAEFTGHPQYVQFSEALEQRIKAANDEYSEYLAEKETAGENYDDLRVAKKLLDRVMKKWTDSPDYATAKQDIDQLIAKVKKPRIRTAEKSLDDISATTTAGSTGGAAAIEVKWEPIESDSECTPRLAGYGTRARAICFDMIHSSARGPLMVVVPNGESFEKPFAIAKYEVSVSDWSKYCILSGTCKPIKDKARRNEPMTGITLQRAREYAEWLSERTGKRYRIPNKQEWEYAANAGGKQPKKDFNCRVSVGDKLIKGKGAVSVKSGKSNGWGLKNYVGNVQEWVTNGGATTVKGGAFTDAHSKCDISLERSHDGNAEENTGFRLLREDIG